MVPVTVGVLKLGCPVSPSPSEAVDMVGEPYESAVDELEELPLSMED